MRKDGYIEEMGECDDSELEELLSEHLNALAKISYETEEKRGRDLRNSATSLLTCITILSVAVLTPLSFLFEYCGHGSTSLTTEQVRLAWMYLLILVPLFTGLLLLLFCQARKKGSALESPNELAKYIKNTYSNYMDNKKDINKIDISVNYCKALEESFVGMLRKNDYISNIIKVVSTLVCISTSILIISIVFVVINLV